MTEPLPDMLARLRSKGWMVPGGSERMPSDSVLIPGEFDPVVMLRPGELSRLLAIAEAAQAREKADVEYAAIEGWVRHDPVEVAAYDALQAAEDTLRAALDGNTTEERK